MKIGFSFVITTLSCAVNTPAWSTPLHSRSSQYEVELVVDGRPVRTFGRRGETYALGHLGERYTIRIHNRSARRVEAVVAVDGRDVVDGRPGDFENKRGYLVPPWGSVDIEGWRTSELEAAAFRFSSVADSYAAQMGSARNLGVVGVAIFPERVVPSPPPAYAPPRRQNEDDFVGNGLGSLGEQDSKASPPVTAAPAKKPADKSERFRGDNRPGLGTEYGEARYAPVERVEFVRARSWRPDVVLGVRYNDHEGLLAIGIDVDRRPYYSDEELRATANPFPQSYAAPPPGWRR